MGREMTEAQLLDSVLQLCRLLHLRTMHQRPARTQHGWATAVQGDGKGWPDLAIAGPHGMLFRELKSTRGRLSQEQETWLTALVDAGQDATVWRPREWHDGTVRLELDRLARSRVTT